MRTVEEIHIRISEDGSRVVSRNIQQIGEQANSTERMLSLMKRALAGLVTGVVINQLKELVDTYTSIQNKLRLTTIDQANLNSVFKELQEISRRSLTSLEATSDMYSKLAVNAKELGLSQRDVLAFTEQLSKTIKISGANGSEASAGLTQLGQALASGRLQGDELRSVLENLPAVADVIAKHFNATRGQLRQMGQDGKLSAKDIIAAFDEAKQSIDTKFAKVVPTISDGFVQLRNQILTTVGALNETSAASGGIGVSLKFVADTLKDITPELVNFTRALMGTLDPFDELSDAGKVFASVFTTVYGVVKAVIQIVTTGLTTAFKIAGQSIGAIFAIQDQLLHGDFAGAARTIKDNWVDNFRELSKGMAEIGTDLVGTSTATVDKLSKIWGEGGRQIREVQITASKIGTERSNPVTIVDPKELEKEMKELEKLQNQLRTTLNEIAPIEGAQLEMAKATLTLQQAQNKGLITTQQQAEYLQLLGDHYRDILDPIGAFNRQIAQETHLLSMGSRERQVEAEVIKETQQLREKGIILTEQETQALRESLTALQSYTELVEAQDRLLDSTVGKRRDFLTQLEALQNLMKSSSSGFTKDDATKAQADLLSSIGIDLNGTQTAIDAQLAALREMYDQIEQMRQAGVISETQSSEAIAQVRKKQRELEFKNTSDFLTGIASLQQAGNEKLFKIGKAAAIANATVSYFQAIMNAYATQPWYVGLAQGIAATVQLGNVISQLKNTKYQGAGFMSGGYTGNSPVNQAVGPVHGQEYVLNAAATRRIGVANLDRLQRGQATLSSGGGAARGMRAGGGAPSVEIYNYGSDKEFEVEQMSEDRVRIIARDVAREQVYEHAPKSIAGEFSNPNSTVSRSLNRNVNVSRKR